VHALLEGGSLDFTTEGDEEAIKHSVGMEYARGSNTLTSKDVAIPVGLYGCDGQPISEKVVKEVPIAGSPYFLH